MSKFHSLNIKDIKKETPDSVSISFDIPEHLASEFSFISGQYLTLKTIIDGNEVRRSYSICSAPKSNELRVAVKQIKNGVFSTYANTSLKAGDAIEVAVPEGRFTLKPFQENKKAYAAFAAGSGITPVLSMIKDVLTNEPQSSFILLYSNKTPQDTIFYDELIHLQNEYKDQFFLYYTFTRSNEKDALFGRIDTEKVNYILKNKHKEATFDSFYLCGPEEMVKLVSNQLQGAGYSKEKIHYELFTPAKKEETPATSAFSDFNGSAQVTILLDDEETTITVKENETILDAALKNGIDAPYSCQGGICSSCMCLVTEGKVAMRQNSVLTDSEIEDGLTLACQSVPKSAIINIDFDDI